MIVQEKKQYGSRTLIHTYSDEGFFIERDGTQYATAVDMPDSNYVYSETAEKIPQPEDYAYRWNNIR